MNPYPLLVAVLALAATSVIILGAESAPGSDEACESCHGRSFPEGGYRFKGPMLVIDVPDNVTAGSSFMVMVSLKESEPYSLLDPSVELDTRALPGASVSGPVKDMAPSNDGFQAVFRVEGAASSGRLTARAVYTVHYDHPDAGNPDISGYQESASAEISVLPSDGGAVEGPAADDSPGPGALGAVLALLSAAACAWLRRKR